MTEIWTRFEDYRVAGPVDEFGDVCGPGHSLIRKIELPVEKHTPCGVRLCTGRFVLRDATRRYACPTAAEAKTSFLARKRKQRRILQEQLRRVEEVIKLGEAIEA